MDSTAAEQPSPAGDGFDIADIDPGGLKGRIAAWLFDEPQWWMGLLRRFWPVARLPGGWVMVTRFDDVQEVLTNERVFNVPFGERMMEMTGGPNFVLGMQDGPDYQRNHAQILGAFRREDVDAAVRPLSARFAAEIVAASTGRLDAIEDLITRVPTMLCESYYGVAIPDKLRFAQ